MYVCVCGENATFSEYAQMRAGPSARCSKLGMWHGEVPATLLQVNHAYRVSLYNRQGGVLFYVASCGRRPDIFAFQVLQGLTHPPTHPPRDGSAALTNPAQASRSRTERGARAACR
jgi:hypothetical protein